MGSWAAMVSSSARCTSWHKSRPNAEVLLHLLIAGLFREQHVPPGDVLDVGANDGEMACFYASLDSARTVHALEPSQTGYDRLVTRFQDVKNVAIMRAGLGSDEGFSMGGGKMSAGMQGISLGFRRRKRETAFPIHRLDSLFGSRGALAGRKLGFWHLDVEGYEMHALRGATDTLARDQPMLAVEVHVHGNQSFTTELVSALLGMGYKLSVVDEVCGRLDCRNLLAAPAHLADSWMKTSTSYQLALVSGATFPIRTADELFQLTPSTVDGLNSSCTLRHHQSAISNSISKRWVEGRLGR